MGDQRSAASSPAPGDENGFDIAAPRNLLSLVIVETAALAVSNRHGHRYVYAGIGAVALLYPLPTALVGIALCFLDVLDVTSLALVLGTAFLCRTVVIGLGTRSPDGNTLTAEDRSALGEATEYRSTRWYLDHSRVDEAVVKRLRAAGLVRPRAVRRRSAGGPNAPKLSELTPAGAQLAQDQMLLADGPPLRHVWRRTTGSSAAIALTIGAVLLAAFLGWRTVPGVVDTGRTAADLRYDLDAPVTQDDFERASLILAQTPDARSVYEPLACRLYGGGGDELAATVLQSSLLAHSSLDAFASMCHHTPRAIAVMPERAEVLYLSDPLAWTLMAKTGPTLRSMDSMPRFTSSLRLAACVNDARGNKLLAGHQLSVARGLEAQEGLSPSAGINALCPVPRAGYREDGTGVDTMIRPTDYAKRVERSLA